MLKKSAQTITCALFLYSATAMASFDRSGYEFSIYAGATQPNVSPSRLHLVGEIDSLFPNTDRTSIQGVGGGYRFVMPNKNGGLHDIRLGLDAYYFETTQTGQVWLYGIPQYYNYNYNMPLSSLRLMVDSEWTLHGIGSSVFPFFIGGIGVTNNTMRYSDTPLPVIGGNGVSMNQNSQLQFAYSLGLGLKFLLAQNVDLSLRYLYNNLGQAQTAKTANIPTLGPVTANVSTQDLLLGLSYLF